MADNLMGTPEQVCGKVAAFEDAGLDRFYATLFVANTVDEMADQRTRTTRPRKLRLILG